MADLERFVAHSHSRLLQRRSPESCSVEVLGRVSDPNIPQSSCKCSALLLSHSFLEVEVSQLWAAYFLI